MTLEGSSASITGPLVSATVAEADFVGSAWLVAITEMAFGDGAAVGAVYRPLALTEPQAAPAHPWPATALAMLQLTAVFVLPVTVAKNCRVLRVPVEGAKNAYGGAIVTLTGPVMTLIRIVAVPLREGSAWLIAVSVTGFVGGADAGAT